MGDFVMLATALRSHHQLHASGIVVVAPRYDANGNIASFRGDAAIRSLPEQSGHSASRANRTGFVGRIIGPCINKTSCRRGALWMCDKRDGPPPIANRSRFFPFESATMAVFPYAFDLIEERRAAGLRDQARPLSASQHLLHRRRSVGPTAASEVPTRGERL
jgi:hypothetical protein